jgi:Glycosyltransferase sugar-binding region containing DXD motif
LARNVEVLPSYLDIFSLDRRREQKVSGRPLPLVGIANTKLTFRFLETYDAFDKNILRVDAVRYMYMHRFGGVYVDLDFEAVGAMDKVLKDKAVVLGRMGSDTAFIHSLPNAWYA